MELFKMDYQTVMDTPFRPLMMIFDVMMNQKERQHEPKQMDLGQNLGWAQQILQREMPHE